MPCVARRPHLFALIALLAVAGLCRPSLVRGCALDGVPSLRADGVAAVLNHTQPTRTGLAHWAPFVFARTFRTGQPIRLDENLRELARTLPPEIVHGRWSWTLGDGSLLEGHRVIHRYSHSGTYLVLVGVVLPHSTRTFKFDAALLHVVP